MGTTQGAPLGTDVQHTVDLAVVEQINHDAQLIGNYVDALTRGNKTSGMLISDMAGIAVAIVELHEAGTWSRTIDGDTGTLFTSRLRPSTRVSIAMIGSRTCTGYSGPRSSIN